MYKVSDVFPISRIISPISILSSPQHNFWPTYTLPPLINPNLLNMGAQYSDDKVNAAIHEEDPDIPMKGEHTQVFDYAGGSAKTNPVEIALVRKLDMRIMPALWAMYFMNYLDRNAIANARLNNIENDLGLRGSQ